jgi:hypothetical protein
MITTDFFDVEDSLAGFMEAEVYYAYGSGWSERKNQQVKLFRVNEGSYYYVDLYFQREKGFENQKQYFSSSVIDTSKLSKYYNMPDTIITLEITKPEKTYRSNLFYASLYLLFFGTIFWAWGYKNWTNLLIIGIFIGFIALSIWAES